MADYYRMGEVGILAADARVELIDGEIIDMVPPGSVHAATVHAHREVQRAYSQVDEPDLGAPLEVSALPGIGVDLKGLFGG